MAQQNDSDRRGWARRDAPPGRLYPSVQADNIAPVETQYFASLQFAQQIVRQAAQLARRIQAEMVRATAISKNDRSPVTVADFAIQALVARSLMETQHFASVQTQNIASLLVAEEDSSILRDSPLLEQVTAFVSGIFPDATPSDICEWIDRGKTVVGAGVVGTDTRVVGADTRVRPYAPGPTRYWLLDPIDGTKGFLRGGQYAVALALMVDGQAQIGVLGCPDLQLGYISGCLVYAVRGQGTWVTSLDEGTDASGRDAPPGRLYAAATRLQVSQRGDPAQARLMRSFEAGHTNVNLIEQFAAVLGVQAEPVLMDSQVKYAVLAAGEGDLMLRLLSPDQPNYREKAWDQAAGSLVVEEAGGRATDLDGKPFDFTAGRELFRNRGVLVSNGLLHDAALQALRVVGA